MKTFESKFYRKHGRHLPKIKTDASLYGSLQSRPRRMFFSGFRKWVEKTFRAFRFLFQGKSYRVQKKDTTKSSRIKNRGVAPERKSFMQSHGFHRKAIR